MMAVEKMTQHYAVQFITFTAISGEWCYEWRALSVWIRFLSSFFLDGRVMGRV